MIYSHNSAYFQPVLPVHTSFSLSYLLFLRLLWVFWIMTSLWTEFCTKAPVRHDLFYDSVRCPHYGVKNSNLNLNQQSQHSNKPGNPGSTEVVVIGDSPEQSKPLIPGVPLSKPYQDRFASCGAAVDQARITHKMAPKVENRFASKSPSGLGAVNIQKDSTGPPNLTY